MPLSSYKCSFLFYISPQLNARLKAYLNLSRGCPLAYDSIQLHSWQKALRVRGFMEAMYFKAIKDILTRVEE